MKHTEKIKFGILCNSLVFEAWEAACINHLLNHPQIELKLLVANKTIIKAKQGILQKLGQYQYRNFLFRAYKRFVLKAQSFDYISFEAQFKTIPKLNCTTIKKGKFSEYFNSEDINEIKSYQLDFMLRFGFNIIKGDILKSCKYGIWSFHHADNDLIRGGPIGFWEIYLKRNTTAAVLQQLNSNLDEGKVLRKGYLKTVAHSYAENIDQLTEMTAIWPLQVCIDLLNQNEIIQNTPNNAEQSKLYKYPKNWQFLYFILLLLKNKIYFHFEQLFLSESWQIARFEGNIDSLTHQSKIEASYISKSRSETYNADPFLWPNNDHKLMLFEHFSYKENIGKIAMSNEDGSHFKVIDFGIKTHLSYPFCFEHETQVYCLPEQAESNKVTLYKLNADGQVSVFKDLLQNFASRDASLIFYDFKWWLFCTKANCFENAALFIFYADSLYDDFKPHQNNPVKVDVQNARPAGNLFVKENKLYRPAQNNAKLYGHKVHINEVTQLSKKAFSEEIVHTVLPEKFGNYKGIHHVTHQNGQTLVDLKQTKFSLYNFRYQISRKIKRILGKD